MLSENGFVKLIDFGLAVKIQNGKFLTRCGTPHYISPEIIQGSPFDAAADWWSFGVLLYEMVVGATPFNGSTKEELFQQILTEDVKLPAYLSQDLRGLLSQLLERDLQKRLCSRRR